MSYDPFEQEKDDYLEVLYEELGPQWAEEHGLAPYDEVIREFTAERLQSYYVANPNLARPAYDALVYAESLSASHPMAALVFSATAIELAIKSALLKPIVFGLVHTELLADLITDLTTQHNGTDRFHGILTQILSQFGGVDLKTFRRRESKKTLWQEIGDLQKARNAVLHRSEVVADSVADLGISVATTLLKEIFPHVLTKLELHLHDPMMVCAERHDPSLFNEKDGPWITP